MNHNNEENDQRPGFWAVVLSTIAAAFGVQSRANQERDFRHGNIWVFIAAGLTFTALFVLTVFLVVRAVLA